MAKNNLHPIKLLLWVTLGTISMMFIAFTSAYIVKKAGGNWVDFNLPSMFIASTFIILLSSLTMNLAVNSFAKKSFSNFKSYLSLTFLLGIVFIFLQVLGWKQLVDIEIHLVGNPSGSFIYVITATHAAHILAGIIALIILLIDAFLHLSDPIKKLIYETNPNKSMHINNMATYWHFMGGVWVYLYIFFYVNNL